MSMGTDPSGHRPASASTTPVPEVTWTTFNQDMSCVAFSGPNGVRVYDTATFSLLLDLSDIGPVSIIEMLFKSAMMAMAGHSTEENPTSSNRKMHMVDIMKRTRTSSVMFDSRIYNIKMNTRRVVVLLKDKIHIFDLREMPKQLTTMDRVSSKWADPALAWLCCSRERGYLATPMAYIGSVGPGQVRGSVWSAVPNLEDAAVGLGLKPPTDQRTSSDGQGVGLIELYDTYTCRPIGIALAHHFPVQTMCMNPSGQMLATASTKGTVVRVFSVPSMHMIMAYRRGTSNCRIFNMSFSLDSGLLCAATAGGTVHVFKNSDKVLASLPLQSEADTLGAAQKSMERVASKSGKRRNSQGSNPKRAAGASQEEEEDLDDWNVVEESPDRELEMSLGGDFHSGGSSGSQSRKSAFQTLADLREHAVNNLPRYTQIAKESSGKYAKQLISLLPQNCRDLVDAPRAFAWVHLQDAAAAAAAEAEGVEEAEPGPQDAITSVSAVGAEIWQNLSNVWGSGPEHGKFLAAVRRGPDGSAVGSEVIVIGEDGVVQVFEINVATGGECTLKSKTVLAGYETEASPSGPGPGAHMQANRRPNS
mmetsp:Transcript_11093/g.24453  ORF Transcript_11093/g.24453 Transcript_11093/m.24453 type:complete len:589 (-) Transcript_11093:257-2023(-)